MNLSTILNVAAGLGLFLYGMKMMSESLEKAAGDRLRRLLELLTKNRIMGILVGCIFTMLIQSSSATTVMVVGFVNAGLMNLAQAIGVIMGANLGTTFTSIIIALNVTQYAPIFLIIGVGLVLFSKKPNVNKVAHVIIGFGILFVGLNLMSGSLKTLKDDPNIVSLMSKFTNPLLAVLAGVLVTSIIQSSSASIGILQTLSAQGLVPFGTAIYIVFGCNIGTCVDGLLSSIGGKKDAKRAAFVHLLFNTFGTVVMLIILNIIRLPVVDWIETLLPNNFSGQVSAAHIIFNLVSVVVFFPFANILAKVAKLIVPGEDPKPAQKKLLYLDDNVYSVPTMAAVQVRKEVHRMAELVIDNLDKSWQGFLNKDMQIIEQVQQNEDVINFLNHEITHALIRINTLDLPQNDVNFVGTCFHVVNDLERVGDHADNICEFTKQAIDNNFSISEIGAAQLSSMMSDVLRILKMSLEVFDTENKEMLTQIEELENHIDDCEKELQQAHIDRLTQGQCRPAMGMIFSDIVSNLERVADHATNVAYSVIETEYIDVKD